MLVLFVLAFWAGIAQAEGLPAIVTVRDFGGPFTLVTTEREGTIDTTIIRDMRTDSPSGLVVVPGLALDWDEDEGDE